MAGFVASLFGGGGNNTPTAASTTPVSSSGGRGSARARGWFRGGTGKGPPSKEEFSLVRLQELYDALSQFRESDLEKQGGGDDVVEMVRQITEALVWGEQKDDSGYFDFFCEKSILMDFIRVLNLPKAPQRVKVQLLQTLSMLLQNIRREQSLFYLLSNHQVNKLISMPLDFGDEEILAYYITLLKTLAMRLDQETIKFFFIPGSEPRFPLYIEATKFFDHKDQMVRATVRTITLCVYPIDFGPMRDFVSKHAEAVYFRKVACHLGDIWLRLQVAITSADFASFQRGMDLQQDLLLYLADVFAIGVPRLSDLLARRLMEQAVLPVLFGSRATDPGAPQQPRDENAPVFPPALAMFLIREVLDTIRSPALSEQIARDLLLRRDGSRIPRPSGRNGSLPPEAFLPHHLRSSDEKCVLAAAGVAGALIKSRHLFATGMLETAGVLFNYSYPSKIPEITEIMLRLFNRQAGISPQTASVVSFAVRELLSALAVEPRNETNVLDTFILHSVRDAAVIATGDLLRLLRAPPAEPPGIEENIDAFLEELRMDFEEPEATVPLGDTDVCWNALIRPHDGLNASLRAVRMFVLLRRLHADCVRFLAPRPSSEARGQKHGGVSLGALQDWAFPSAESLGASLVGHTIELCDDKCISCQFAASDEAADQMLSFVMHETAFLIARPETETMSAGGTVVTMWPLAQVQSMVDRGDPRVMHLAMTGPEPSLRGRGDDPLTLGPNSLNVDCSSGNSSKPIMASLFFQDVQACHVADAHVQKCRSAARIELRHLCIGFVTDYQAKLELLSTA